MLIKHYLGILLSTTAIASSQILITIQPQSDNTGSRVSLSGALNSADLFVMGAELRNQETNLVNFSDTSSVPSFELINEIQVSHSFDFFEIAHEINVVSDTLSLSTPILQNPVPSSTPATYVSGDLGFQLFATSIPPEPDSSADTLNSFIITSASNSLGLTPPPVYNFDLVLDVENDISEYADLEFNWDSNGAFEGGFTINTIVIPEPSSTALIALGVVALIGRRKR